ncbi:DUF3817 domain-containing protein [Leptospira sp. 96542]|nr:DUF3817 domain-containing protein [Leptospira sp. 96542]
MFDLFKTSFGRFRVLAFCEGVSFLLILFATMPLKYFYAWPEPNKIVGMIHGLLFVFYIYSLISVRVERLWTWKQTGLAALAAILPFGTFIAEKTLFREAKQVEN